jgi:hypothetical protein
VVTFRGQSLQGAFRFLLRGLQRSGCLFLGGQQFSQFGVADRGSGNELPRPHFFEVRPEALLKTTQHDQFRRQVTLLVVELTHDRHVAL